MAGLEPPPKRARRAPPISASAEGMPGTVRTMELVARLPGGDGALAGALAGAVAGSPLSLGFASGVAAGCAPPGAATPTVFVVDRGRKRVIKLDESAAVSDGDGDGDAPGDGTSPRPVTASEAWRSAEVVLPQMVALAAVGPGAASSRLVVTDSRRCRVVEVCGASGRVLRVLAGCGMSGGRDGRADRATFAGPWGVAAHPATGDVYVSEYFGCKIRVIRRGDVTTLAGSGPRGGRADGVGPAASFAGPRGVCLDAARNCLYVADSGNHCVRRLDLASGAVTTVAGDGTRGYADGDAGGARFDEPTAVALDADGALYVADQENRRVRCLRGRTVSTLAGGGAGDSADGVGAAASFSAPNSLHLCPEIRRLYVGDKQCVRVVTLPDLAAAPDAASRRAANLAAAPRNGDAGDGLPPCPPDADPTACVWCAPRAPAGEGAD